MSFDPSSFLAHFDAGQLEALVETMLLAADADGEVSAEERAELARNIEALVKDSELAPAFAPPKVDAMLAAALQKLAAEGREARIAHVKTTLDTVDRCRGALALAIAVTAADGIVRTSERELIMDLANGLEIDPDVAADMVRDITRS
jgi:tellurite resistance protein